jgi:hypothetical protein
MDGNRADGVEGKTSKEGSDVFRAMEGYWRGSMGARAVQKPDWEGVSEYFYFRFLIA